MPGSADGLRAWWHQDALRSRRLWCRTLVRTWWRRPHWFPELYSSLALLGFAAWSMYEPISLPGLRTFREVSRIMPASAWDCAAGCVGLAQFTALWVDRRWLRGGVAFLAAWLLSAISLGAMIGYPSPIDVFPLVFLVMNLMALARAVGNAP